MKEGRKNEKRQKRTIKREDPGKKKLKKFITTKPVLQDIALIVFFLRGDVVIKNFYNYKGHRALSWRAPVKGVSLGPNPHAQLPAPLQLLPRLARRGWGVWGFSGLLASPGLGAPDTCTLTFERETKVGSGCRGPAHTQVFWFCFCGVFFMVVSGLLTILQHSRRI